MGAYYGAYYRLNYLNAPDNQWPKLKVKFNFLVRHHQEWKTIREKAPLDYLPYMEAQFEVVTGLKLVGLGAYTGWIRASTYYHWVVAQQGQLGWCPELAGVNPPRGPMHLPLYPPVTPPPPMQSTGAIQIWGRRNSPASTIRYS